MNLDEQAQLLESNRLKHYRLLSKLGQGGMGVVYSAYDEKLDRKVALKLLRSESFEARRRLVREAQSMAKLSHSNVVQIYEIGEAGPLIFIVMQFVKGRTLRQWLREQPRSRAEIIEAFCAAGEGLVAAHAAGLVHRDFKPDNVMLRDDGRVLVMDFGIAHLDASEREELDRTLPTGELASLTATGVLVGTPAYMAPEQFELRETDARTDQFSFCVALWEALYGSRPFSGTTLMELSVAVRSGTVVAPEQSDVPSWLRHILERGLAVEPEQRWPSLRALLDALRVDPTRRRRGLVLAGAGVLGMLALLGVAQAVQQRKLDEQALACAREAQALRWNDEVAAELRRSFQATGLPYASSAWERTHALLDAYAQSWIDARTQSCHETHVEQQRDLASYAVVQTCLDERRATFEGLLAAWTDLDEHELARATAAAARLPPVSSCTTEPQLAQRMQPPVELEAEVTRLRLALEQANALEYAGAYDEGLARAQQVLVESEALGWLPLIVDARLLVAQLHQRLGAYAPARVAAEQAYTDAVAAGHDIAALSAALVLTTLIGDQLADSEVGSYWGRLGRAYIQRMGLGESLREADLLTSLGAVSLRAADFALAREQLEQALRINEATAGPDHIRVAITLTSIGTVLWQQGEHEAALARYRDAARIQKLVLGDTHPHVATTYNNIGAVQLSQGDADEALESFRTALAIREAVFGPRHPSVASAQSNVGAALADLGRYAEALETFRRAYDIQAATLGLEHPDLAGTLTNIANVLYTQEQLEEALATHLRALAILEAALGPEHPDVALSLNNIGNAQQRVGQLEEALTTHRRALAIRFAAFGPEHADVAMSLDNIGGVLYSLGELDEALASHERGLVIRETTLGSDHVEVATSLDNVANLQIARGRPEEALVAAERSLMIRELAFGRDHVDVAYSLTLVGEVELMQGKLDRARARLEQALAIHERSDVLPVESAYTRFTLACVLWELGERERALELANLAHANLVEFAGASGRSRRDLAKVDAWLRAR